jgi:hypothetical protein
MRLSLLVGVALLGVPSPLTAQATATFAGRVLDALTGRPLREARLAVLTTGGSTQTDSLGRFEMTGLPVGIHRFLVSAPGYARGAVSLAFAPRERMERDLELEPVAAATGPAASPGPDRADSVATRPGPATTGSPAAQALPGVAVTAEPMVARRFADFERRRATGRGQYLTRAALDSLQAYTLQDALRGLRGVTFACAGSACRAQMVRAPLGCSPEYVVDERVDNTFGPLIPIRDIQGIEVYSGVSDVPGEFAGRNSGCGVIVIWTTSGREARRR